jgi:hypothetical protein
VPVVCTRWRHNMKRPRATLVWLGANARKSSTNDEVHVGNAATQTHRRLRLTMQSDREVGVSRVFGRHDRAERWYRASCGNANDGAMTAVLPVKNWHELSRAIVVAEQAGFIGTAHLLRAIAAGRIALLPLLPHCGAAGFRAFALATRDRPAVVLIGDDDGLGRGPDAWTRAGRAVAWSRCVFLHAAGAELFHYECAIKAAQLLGRCLLVECDTGTLPAWRPLVRTAPHTPRTVIIRPHQGTHPLPVPGEAMH